MTGAAALATSSQQSHTHTYTKIKKQIVSNNNAGLFNPGRRLSVATATIVSNLSRCTELYHSSCIVFGLSCPDASVRIE
jgi:hypothetical protein